MERERQCCHSVRVSGDKRPCEIKIEGEWGVGIATADDSVTDSDLLLNANAQRVQCLALQPQRRQLRRHDRQSFGERVQREGLERRGSAELLPEEERILIRHIALAAKANSKEGDVVYLLTQRIIKVWKSCRLRLTNYLRPDLKSGLLSEYEEKICGMTRFAWKMRR